MKIGELDQHCGNCSIIEYCAEPFCDLCLCGKSDLDDVEESKYRKMAEEIQSRNKRHISNSAMADKICMKLRELRRRGKR